MIRDSMNAFSEADILLAKKGSTETRSLMHHLGLERTFCALWRYRHNVNHANFQIMRPNESRTARKAVQSA
jgi:hypothetical protein